MVNLARLAGLEHDADPRALRAAHQMMMHGAAREQELTGTRSGPTLRSDSMIMLNPSSIALFGFGADSVDRALQAAVAVAPVEGDVDRESPASRDNSCS